MQTSRQAVVTSRFVHAFNTDNYNLYKSAYAKTLPCDKKPERYSPIAIKLFNNSTKFVLTAIATAAK